MLASFVHLLAVAATVGGALIPSPPPTHSAAGSAARLPRLSLDQLAGQRVIYSYSGLTPPASLIQRIRAAEAAGVIFFADNISSDTQLKRVAAQLQHAAAQSPVKAPLLMMTDQEGGLVRRLPGAPALSEKQVGNSRHPVAAATQAGRGAGLNLRSVGVNVNLAPVLDVYRAPGNFIDAYGRSYSSNPQTVAQLGKAFIAAQQRTGVAATAKHFPGLGAASFTQNTDLRPAVLNVSLSSLRATDELPYRSAIATGVRLVMVSWGRYPSLDRSRPAGLSPVVVRSELRGRLRFTGVTITDALAAGALRAYGGTSSRALLAARAGMDLLLCASETPTEGSGAVSALSAAVRRGRLDATTFRAAVSRVLALRSAVPG